MKAGETKLPVPARREGKSILYMEILGMESHPEQQGSPVQVLQLPCPPMTALVLLFHPRLGVFIRKNLPRWMLLSRGPILSLGATSGTQDPALGWLAFRAARSSLPFTGGIAQGAGRQLGPQRWMPPARR